MSHKAAAIRIIAALGIPLFPLGAHFLLVSRDSPDIRETIPESGESQKIQSAIPETATLLQTPPEILALLFSRPDQEAEETQASKEAPAVRAAPVPGDGKFSYLGLIRESSSQEWLCVKEEETGRILFVDARLASAHEDRWALEIEGVSYSIGSN
jgi:hypothetical protein